MINRLNYTKVSFNIVMNWKRKSYKTNLKRQCHNWICWTIELNTQTVCLNENKLIDTIISYCYTYLCCLYFTWTNVCVAWFSFHGFTITCLTTILRVDTSSRPWMGATPASNWACTPACPTSPFTINCHTVMALTWWLSHMIVRI